MRTSFCSDEMSSDLVRTMMPPGKHGGYHVRRSSQFDAAGCAEAIDEVRVRGGEPPSAKLRVRDEEPIEGVPCPAQIQRPYEPRCGRRIVQDPPIVVDDGLRPAVEVDPPGFVEELQLQQRHGREMEATRREPPRP